MEEGLTLETLFFKSETTPCSPGLINRHLIMLYFGISNLLVSKGDIQNSDLVELSSHDHHTDW